MWKWYDVIERGGEPRNARRRNTKELLKKP